VRHCQFLPAEIGELTMCPACGRRVRYRGKPLYARCRPEGEEEDSGSGGLILASPSDGPLALLSARLEKLRATWHMPATNVSRAMVRAQTCFACEKRFPKSDRWPQRGCLSIGRQCSDKTHWAKQLMVDRPVWPVACPQVGTIKVEDSPMVFERVVCISLDKRPDRWERFLKDLPADWPFKQPERFQAIDGAKCPPPDWWRQGGGPWGCYRSHLRILEECLSAGTQSVLILEEDAQCEPDFARRFAEFWQAVPNDWGMAYLGGQLLNASSRPPDKINDRVARPWNVNRTHAYAVHRRAMPKLYQYLCGVEWKAKHHVDHYYGALHASGKVPVYCPMEWLMHQNDTKGVIGSKVARWPGAGEVIAAHPPRPAPIIGRVADASSRPFVVVVGLHRSGSSCLAGVLAKLGVHMGVKFVGCEPDGGHEAHDLARMCEQALPFPGTRIVWSEARIKDRLESIIKTRWREADGRGARLAGGKYPHLCAMGKQLTEILGERLVVIHAERPLEESIASLIRRDGKRRQPAKLEACQRWLWDRKQEFLATPELNLHTVEYDRLVADPLGVVTELAAFLSAETGERISLDQIQEAAQYVRPEMRHIQSQGVQSTPEETCGLLSALASPPSLPSPPVSSPPCGSTPAPA